MLLNEMRELSWLEPINETSDAEIATLIGGFAIAGGLIAGIASHLSNKVKFGKFSELMDRIVPHIKRGKCPKDLKEEVLKSSDEVKANVTYSVLLNWFAIQCNFNVSKMGTSYSFLLSIFKGADVYSRAYCLAGAELFIRSRHITNEQANKLSKGLIAFAKKLGAVEKS